LHERLGGRMVPFAGFAMPVQYTSIVDEHRAARETAALFDVSHMGQIALAGAAAARTPTACARAR
jgi:aminomethyltransferase